jgi:hypothetical protein
MSGGGPGRISKYMQESYKYGDRMEDVIIRLVQVTDALDQQVQKLEKDIADAILTGATISKDDIKALIKETIVESMTQKDGKIP